MELRLYDRADAPEVLRLWNTAGTAAGYAPLDAEGLGALLLAHPAFCAESTFVLEERGALRGFAAGCTGDALAQGAVRGYVSCVLLEEDFDTAENTALLLGAIEDSFRAKGKSAAAVTFFNPLRLPWIIPGTAGHQHNNMPGIPKDIPLYERMLSLGYREAATEMAMYLDLAAFTYPAAMEERAAKMAAQGYTVDWYKEGVHRGVDEMVRSLGNSMWDAEIPAAAHGGMRLLVGLSGESRALPARCTRSRRGAGTLRASPWRKRTAATGWGSSFFTGSAVRRRSAARSICRSSPEPITRRRTSIKKPDSRRGGISP